MARKNLINIETRLVNGWTQAEFHFRSNDPIGATEKPLRVVGYKQQPEYKTIGIDAQNLVTEIFAHEGVDEISTKHHSVTITIAKAYTLDEFIPKVVAIIATLFYYEWDMLDDIVIEYLGSSKPSSAVECHFYETGQTQFDIDHIKRMKQVS